MTIVATRHRRRLNLIVASFCAIAIVVGVVFVVAQFAFAVIVDFIVRCAIAIVNVVVFTRRNHHCRHCMSRHCPPRRSSEA